ncbi:hypothetical protein ACRYJU_06905 [Alloalcanivorax xenomutans]|uniref:hypothetical protein n=1 Tax=Alloalcanivorax xenomutans TaxID=1094342 RepID=UPI0024E26201|nr:hypothetical protein [Alloalcanivorax xenomutans]WOD30082.1 hypothetical protein RYH70_08400 [Alloalcanivorax xenomutans]
MMKIFVAALAVVILPVQAVAGTAAGYITGLMAHSGGEDSGPGVFMFTLDGDRNNAPSCSTENGGKDWAMSLESEAGRAMYALVLSAHAQGKRIYVTGTGHCNSWGDREQPEWISVGQ